MFSSGYLNQTCLVIKTNFEVDIMKRVVGKTKNLLPVRYLYVTCTLEIYKVYLQQLHLPVVGLILLLKPCKALKQNLPKLFSVVWILSVIRVNLILMQSGSTLEIVNLTDKKFQFYFFLFSLICMLKLKEPIQRLSSF